MFKSHQDQSAYTSSLYTSNKFNPFTSAHKAIIWSLPSVTIPFYTILSLARYIPTSAFFSVT